MLQVVAGIISHKGRILLCQRHRNSSRFPMKWEFPGGKVEDGETPEQAIVRELKEELGIDVGDIQLINNYNFAYKDELPFQLYFFKILNYSGSITNVQFEDILWVKPETILDYDILDGDKAFAEELPRII